MEKSRALMILERLKDRFSITKVKTPFGDPFKTLILTLLSQHTSDKNAIRAFRRLSKRFSIEPRELAEANEEDVKEAIKVAGLYRNKSRVIKRIAVEILEKFEGDLRSILDLPLDQARKTLLSLPGVGPKTADVVLLFCANKPTLPIDIHIFRVSKRLDLASEEASYEGVRQSLQSLYPLETYFSLHILLILLGRTYCRSRNPSCSQCPVNDFCPSRRS